VEHHGAVPLDEDGKRQLGALLVAGVEPLKKLPVRQLPHRPCIEERLDIPTKRLLTLCHASDPRYPSCSPLSCAATRKLLQLFERFTDAESQLVIVGGGTPTLTVPLTPPRPGNVPPK
jgi:hypothetical protein